MRSVTIGLDTLESSDTLNDLLNGKRFLTGGQIIFQSPGFPDARRQVREEIGIDVKQVSNYITDQSVDKIKIDVMSLVEYLKKQNADIRGVAINYASPLSWEKLE